LPVPPQKTQLTKMLRTQAEEETDSSEHGVKRAKAPQALGG